MTIAQSWDTNQANGICVVGIFGYLRHARMTPDVAYSGEFDRVYENWIATTRIAQNTYDWPVPDEKLPPNLRSPVD